MTVGNTSAAESYERAQVERLQSAVEAADHVTVEFGTAEEPLFITQPGAGFNRNNLYVGVNIDSLQHRYLAERVEEVAGFAILSELDAGECLPPLPLPVGSVGTVYLANVLGEPESPFLNSAFRHQGGIHQGTYQGSSSIDTKRTTLEEVRRLLRPDGRLVILETISPFRSRPVFRQRRCRRAPIRTLLEDEGFTVTDSVGYEDERWNAEASLFAEPQPAWDRFSYLITAQKAA